jgi:hypothetical protein
MKLLFPKQNYNVLSPSSYTQISARDVPTLYMYIQDQSAYCAAGKYVDRSWEYIAYRHMNVEIGTEAAQSQKRITYMGFYLQCGVH